MATSPTSKSAPLSNAAKDDALGSDGHFTFTISDLLANDAGGARANTFFFGSALDQSPEKQVQYMLDHGIKDLGGGKYELTSDAIDFQYSVQIGNKGTWSTADVDVTAPPKAPVDTHHADDLLFQENFDGYSMIDDHGAWGVVNLSTGITDESPSKGHAWAIADGNGGWAGVTGEIVQGTPDMTGSIQASSGDFWLDTQNSPGGIDITNYFSDPTGGKFQLSFDLGIHDFGTGPQQETNPNATFQVKVDDKVVANLSYQNVLDQAGGHTDQMGHFKFVVDGGTAPGDHTISFVDTTAAQGYVGFALDTIQVHDWLVI